jgi:hypothetical protein
MANPLGVFRAHAGRRMAHNAIKRYLVGYFTADGLGRMSQRVKTDARPLDS